MQPRSQEKTAAGSYCRWGGRGAGAAVPGVQGVAAGDVPEGGDGGNLRPALLRLQ